MKTMMLTAFLALSVGLGGISAQASSYHAPAHNFYQNNWMAGGGG